MCIILYTMTTKTDPEARVNDARRAYVAAGDAADAVFCAVIQAPEVRAADEALDNAEKIVSLAKDALHLAEQERRAAFAARDAARAAAFQPSDSAARKRAEAAQAAATVTRTHATNARELADRAAWTTGESADMDTRAAEHAAQIARNHAARAVSLAARS